MPSNGGVPEFGDGAPKLTVIGTAKDGLNVPRDLEFNPNQPGQLWTMNAGDSGAVIYKDPGQSDQTADHRVDYYARHFMYRVSAFSFNKETNTFATSEESDNTQWDASQRNFSGPSLWDADLSVFAKVNQGDNDLLGSHIDMLHESPFCMGIAWDQGNGYWVFDGYHGDIVYYNFEKDHGPGGDDHSDGVVHRYSDVEVKRVTNVASHMVLDHKSGLLYIADTGNGRVMSLDTKSGTKGSSLRDAPEPLNEYSEYTGAKYEKVVDGLQQPSGIELNQNRIFVSDHANGQITAYQLDGKLLGTLKTGAKGIMGITIGPDGKIWYVDATANTVVRVDPTSSGNGVR